MQNPIKHIYIHVPFCVRKCGYCSFYSERFDNETKNLYLEHLKIEIKTYLKSFNVQPTTIYFGGGTPSLLKADEIKSILDLFDLSKIQEITLETNPATVTEEDVKNLAEIGINRVSIGVQSFQEPQLKWMGRIHSNQDVIDLVSYLNKYGIENYSFDLIYGLAEQTSHDILATIHQMVKLNPKHISTYCLTLEEDTPLFVHINKLPDDHTVSDMFYDIHDILVNEGFEHYELSNFAKPNYRSQHNTSYWELKEYLGFGPSASGYVGNIRYKNATEMFYWFEQADDKKIFPNKEELAFEDRVFEYIMLKLRLDKGLDRQDFINEFNFDFFEKFKTKINYLTESKYLITTENNIKMNPYAYMVFNEVITELL
jgi:oxygen-independent coproporphyrinogen-3 oxidase